MDLLMIVLLLVVTLCLLIVVYKQSNKIKDIDEGLEEILNNRNHISRIEQNNIEQTGEVNRKIINALADEMDKKIKPVIPLSQFGGGYMVPTGYVLVDLTEDEKKANKLKKELRELEVKMCHTKD